MRGLLTCVLVATCALASCSSGDTKPSSSAPNGGSVTTTIGGHVNTCRPTCTTAADCAQSGNALQDAAHFTCNAGRCDWTGCKSDAECSAAAPQGANFVCRVAAGAPTPTCVPACTTAADCVPQNSSVPLTDAQHFSCNAGVCVWKGCQSTDECKNALQTAKVSCEQPEGAPAPTCVPTCTKAADCVTPGNPLGDASHYTCTAGRCEWKGCHSTSECASALQTSKVICE